MLVFTYGTLMSGKHNNHIMQEAQGVLVGPAQTCESGYMLLDLRAYPAAIDAPPGQPGCSIHGELYEVPDLEYLDELERCYAPGDPDNFYDRREVAVSVGGEVRTAWMYFLVKWDDRYHRKYLPEGRWAKEAPRAELPGPPAQRVRLVVTIECDQRDLDDIKDEIDCIDGVNSIEFADPVAI